MSRESDETGWIAVVGSRNGVRSAVAEALEPWVAPEVFDTVDDALRSQPPAAGEGSGSEGGSGPGSELPSGLVVLAPDVPAEDTLRAVDAAVGGGFVVLQVLDDPGGAGRSAEAEGEGGSDEEDGGFRLRPLSAGFEEPLGQLMQRFAPGDASQGTLLELRHAVGRVRRVRHDINNPLTAALAEVQLLLMDVTEEEAKESLEVVQEQLRRIRERVQELSVLRPPWQ